MTALVPSPASLCEQAVPNKVHTEKADEKKALKLEINAHTVACISPDFTVTINSDHLQV
jgi:hypothetical protein